MILLLFARFSLFLANFSILFFSAAHELAVMAHVVSTSIKVMMLTGFFRTKNNDENSLPEHVRRFLKFFHHVTESH